MRKIVFALLVSLICLSACNLPLPASTQDSAGIVATRVAQTLNALPPSVTPSPLPVLPTNALPTAALETSTPSQTVTLTPTFTATIADPKLSLGSPAYTNTFSNGKDFGLSSPYTDDSVKLWVHDGVLDFSSLALNYGRRYQLTYPKPRDFYLEGIFQTVECSGFDHYGLVTRAPNYTDGYGYYLGFSCNGQFIIQKWDSSGVATLVNWTSDTHILSGSGQTNRIGVSIKGDQIKLYANGALIKEFADSSFSTAGHFGIYGSAIDSTNFSFQVSEISQWNLP